MQLRGLLISTTTYISQKGNLVEHWMWKKILNDLCQKWVMLILLDLIRDSVTVRINFRLSVEIE